MAVSGFTIAIDHHEREPYRFARVGGSSVPTRVVSLGAGKYSLVGYDHEIAVERKTALGLFLCCGMERDLFEMDLEKLAGLPASHLVIETTPYSILRAPPPGSQMDTKSVLASLIAWNQRYGVVPWFCDNRRMGERMTLMILARWYRDNVRHEAESSSYRRARRQAGRFMKPVHDASRAVQKEQKKEAPAHPVISVARPLSD
jgi:hypothetical protein